MNDGDNPYAPPTTRSSSVPSAPKPFGWVVEDGVVKVGKFSRFPMVDPFNGGTDETMMLQKVLVRFRPWWLTWLALPGALCSAAFFGSLDEVTGLLVPALVGAIGGWMLSLLLGLFYPVCTLHLFFLRRTLKIRTISTQVLNVLFLLGILGNFIFSRNNPWLVWIPGVSMICWILGVVGLWIFNRKLRCSGKDGDFFVIRGFHPKAVSMLRMENETGGLQTAR